MSCVKCNCVKKKLIVKNSLLIHMLIEETWYVKLTSARKVLCSTETELDFTRRLKFLGWFGLLCQIYFQKIIVYFLYVYARTYSSPSPGLQSPFSAREHASFSLGLRAIET